MDEAINLKDLKRYAWELFDGDEEGIKAAEIMAGMWAARSVRVSEIARRMPGGEVANARGIFRFLSWAEPAIALNRLHHDEAPYVLMDVTEIQRPQAKRTEYVGRLKDGKTRGFDLLILATPYRGRGIPFHCISYSSRTINEESGSRNLEHRRVLREVLPMLRDRPLVGDREFCYESYFQDLEVEGLQYVIRLNTENKVRITHQPGEKAAQVSLQLTPGQTRYYPAVYYRGKVKMNLAGTWLAGCKEPLWVATNIEAKAGLKVYLSRMKIEESFRDLKSLLHVDEVLSKTRTNMEKLILLMLIVYTIGVLVGEKVRDRMFSGEKKMEPLFWPFHTAQAGRRAEVPRLPQAQSDELHGVSDHAAQSLRCRDSSRQVSQHLLGKN